MFVGRQVPFKGVSMLLDAVKKISDSVPVELIIIGDGSERARRLTRNARDDLIHVHLMKEPNGP